MARKELLIAQFYGKREAWPAVVARLEPMLRRYSESEDRAEALGLLAYAHWKLDHIDEAKKVATRLAEDHPEDEALRLLERKANQLFD